VAVIHGTVTPAGQVGRRSTAETVVRMAGQVAAAGLLGAYNDARGGGPGSADSR
jgi:hypothetical protein